MTRILSQHADYETGHPPLFIVSVTTFRFIIQMLSFPVGTSNKSWRNYLLCDILIFYSYLVGIVLKRQNQKLIPSLGNFVVFLWWCTTRYSEKTYHEFVFTLSLLYLQFAIPEPGQIDTWYEKIKYFSSRMYFEHVVFSSVHTWHI
jgi:hypothetical protein